VTAAVGLPSTLLGELAGASRAAGAVAFLVGGAVRDALLGRRPLDLDVALEGPTDALAALVTALSTKAWTCEVRHGRFGTATLRAPSGERLDLAVTREESYPHPGALPAVTPGVPIGRDLARRDFAIHAMALRLGDRGVEPPHIDPFGGAEDVRHRRIRLLHEGSLADDPTRAFRAARYVARLGFELDPGFRAAMQRGVDAGAFSSISGDRLRRALQEVLSEDNRAVALEVLGRLAVPSAVVEGWVVDADTLRDVDAARGLAAAWPALLGRLPPALREQVATRLSFSRALRRDTGCRR